MSLETKSPESAEFEPPLSREEYLDERKLYITAEHESTKSFDQAMLTLSGGLLALSVTFFEKFIGEGVPQRTWLLGAAWVELLISLLATLVSFVSSRAAWRQHRDLLDLYQGRKLTPSNNRNRASEVTQWMNWMAILFFTAGVAFLIAFILSNLPRG